MSQFYTRPVTMLPGGIPYTDPLTPRKHFPGMEVSTEDEQIKRIIKWRGENKHIYTESKWFDVDSVRQELRTYQKNRLGNSKQFFVDGKNDSIGLEIRVKGPSQPCSCGAIDATAQYCKTCSNSKLTGYKCNSCGKVRGL